MSKFQLLMLCQLFVWVKKVTSHWRYSLQIQLDVALKFLQYIRDTEIPMEPRKYILKMLKSFLIKKET